MTTSSLSAADWPNPIGPAPFNDPPRTSHGPWYGGSLYHSVFQLYHPSRYGWLGIVNTPFTVPVGLRAPIMGRKRPLPYATPEKSAVRTVPPAVVGHRWPAARAGRWRGRRNAAGSGPVACGSLGSHSARTPAGG